MKPELEILKSAQKTIKEILSKTPEKDWETSGWKEFYSKKQELQLDNYDIVQLDRMWNITISDYKKEDEKGTTKADRLLKKILEEKECILFIDERDTPCISLSIKDHREVHRINSSTIKQLISYEGYALDKKAVSAETIKNTVSTLEGMARFDGQNKTLNNRVASLEDGILYDLTNPKWQAIKITKDGWKVIDNPPTVFRRYSHQAPQVTPSEHGDISLLDKYINIKNKEDAKLVTVSLVSFLVPNIPHPAILLSGPQGSSKSTQSKIYSRIVDPSLIEVITLPKNPVELIQQLDHHYFSAYDNVSNISKETSDILCRAITGAGFSKRTLYTNEDDSIFNFRRPLSINGINDVATSPDLLERSITVEFVRIKESDRKQEKDIWSEFDEDLPKIIGGIFDVLVKALNIYPTIQIESLPRMADFTVWGCAIAEAMGYSKESFLSTYLSNINNQATIALNNNPVAIAILSLMKGRVMWSGTATQLLSALTINGAFEDQRGGGIPQNANVLMRSLNELKVSLDSLGISCEQKHTGAERVIHITKLPKMPSLESMANGTNDVF